MINCRVVCVRLALLLLFLVVNVALAACDPAEYDQTITLEGFGTVYVDNLRLNKADDEAELSDGVCFASSGTPQFTLTVPTMRVEQLSTDPQFVAQGATLTLGRYTIFAETLEGDADGLALANLSVMSEQFSGTAVRARYTLENAQTIFSGVQFKLGNFRVEGVAAGLTENTLVLQSARATTCVCENGGLYTLLAPDVVIDLATGLVRVEGGVLETLGLRFGLTPNLRFLLDAAQLPNGRPGGGRIQVGGAALLPAAPAPQPVGTVIDEGTRLALPLQLTPWAGLELGAAGLDPDHPLGLVSLLKLGFAVGRGNLQAVLGRVGPGLRADGLIRTPLAPGVGLDVSTTNRLWADAGYLHEGSLGVYGSRRLTGVLGEVGDALELGGQFFAALSQQTLGGILVQSPRFGVRGTANYVSAPTGFGVFALRTESALTLYPQGGGGADDLTQLGIRLQPSWRIASGIFRAGVGFDQQLVFGASPFSTYLDKLEPRSVVDATLTLQEGASNVSLGARYAFLLVGEKNPVRRLRLDAATTLPVFGVTARTTLSAEFAGLLGPPDPDVDAFVTTQTELILPTLPLELGLLARYDLLPEKVGLKLLEVYASYPFTVQNVTLRPFLGLNAAPLLAGYLPTGDALPVVSGYGLEVAYRSCCGTLRASYRLHDQTVQTSFDIRLAETTP